MKKSRLLGLTIPFATLSMLAPFMSSCSKEQIITPEIKAEHGRVVCSTIRFNNLFTIAYIPENGYAIETVTITIGDKTLIEGADDGYTIDGNVITVNATAVTSNKVIISIKAKQQTVSQTFSFTEPELISDRKASSLVKKTNDGIVYNFNFPGEFVADTVNSVNDKIVATATCSYYPAGSENPISWTLHSTCTIDSDNKFKLNFEDTYPSSSEIKSIPGGTNIVLSSITINNKTSNTSKICQSSYFVTFTPNLLLEETGLELTVTQSTDGPYAYFNTAQVLDVVNPAADTTSDSNYPGFWAVFATKTAEINLRGNYNYFINNDVSYNSAYKTFTVVAGANAADKCQFSTSSLSTEAQEVSLTLVDYFDNVWFKKEIGVGPALKIKLNS